MSAHETGAKPDHRLNNLIDSHKELEDINQQMRDDFEKISKITGVKERDYVEIEKICRRWMNGKESMQSLRKP